MVALVTLLSVTDDRTPVPGFFDLPVTGGTATFDMLGLHPEERGSAIALLARSMFSLGGNAAERAAGVRRHITGLTTPGASSPGNPPALSNPDGFDETGSQPITIAAPLSAEHWRDLLGPQAPRDLFAGLISNRSVLLVCAGTMHTDVSTRVLLERDRGLLRWIARTAPAAFWVSARSIRVENNRIGVPGGSAAEPIWEALTAEKVTRVPEF